jgi:hypothetical protein
LQEINGSLEIPDESLSLNDLRFSRSSTVFAQSLEAGINYHSPSMVDLQFSVGAEHASGTKAGDDPTLASLGFDTTHDGGDRWSFPITLGATYRF